MTRRRGTLAFSANAFSANAFIALAFGGVLEIIVGAPRRRRTAQTFHAFYHRYKKILEEELAVPELPAPVETREVTPETVAIEAHKAVEVVSELDVLLVKVRAELAAQEKELVARRAKRAGTKRVEKKITRLVEKQDVLVEAKAYTEIYVHDRQEEELIILLATRILLQ